MSKAVNVVIKYCSSWGYSGLYAKVARQFKEAASVNIEGMIYKSSGTTAQISTFFWYAFILGIVMLFIGEWFFSSVVPIQAGVELAKKMKENQMPVMAGLFMLNFIASNLTNSGAFEVYFNDQLVHSKLQTGRLPDVPTLLRQIRELSTTS